MFPSQMEWGRSVANLPVIINCLLSTSSMISWWRYESVWLPHAACAWTTPGWASPSLRACMVQTSSTAALLFLTEVFGLCTCSLTADPWNGTGENRNLLINIFTINFMHACTHKWINCFQFSPVPFQRKPRGASYRYGVRRLQWERGVLSPRLEPWTFSLRCRRVKP